MAKNNEKALKPKKTAKQRFQVFLKIILIIIAVFALLAGILAIVNTIGVKSNKNFISSISEVSYDKQLEPTIDDNGYYTFVTDNDFNVMQLTDVHIGAGFMSTRKDNMALNAAAAMISEEKPDLVVVTGDIAYPVPFQAGTFNNKSSAMLFADLMEQLGVYWCLSFGNHDTESYSFFTREDIAKVYENKEKYPHCLFQSGDEDVDGVGNYIINVKNTAGKITQSLVLIDSHSYLDNDKLGILWNYDCIHKSQIEWYENEIASLTKQNAGETPKSLAFFHIPLVELRDAWNEYSDNDFKDTENVQYIYGKAGEQDAAVFSSELNEGFFDSVLKTGSTQGIFCGHDHLNNFSLMYKGVRFTYGYSIDYLAYSGIYKYGAQRGCTMINISPDTSFDCHRENYYQDKYKTVNAKESVDMNDYYSNAE